MIYDSRESKYRLLRGALRAWFISGLSYILETWNEMDGFEEPEVIGSMTKEDQKKAILQAAYDALESREEAGVNAISDAALFCIANEATSFAADDLVGDPFNTDENFLLQRYLAWKAMLELDQETAGQYESDSGAKSGFFGPERDEDFSIPSLRSKNKNHWRKACELMVEDIVPSMDFQQYELFADAPPEGAAKAKAGFGISADYFSEVNLPSDIEMKRLEKASKKWLKEDEENYQDALEDPEFTDLLP